MESLRAWAIGIGAAAGLATVQAASAHTTRICWFDEADGSTTFYARNYHWVDSPVGGLVIDGVTYPFTAAEVGSLPPVSGCQPQPCNAIVFPNSHQIVNVPFVSSRVHQIGVTCNDHDDCGWPGCYPMAMDFTSGCVDSDVDGVCDSDDNCPDLANPGQEDADGEGIGDACDACPFDPTNDEDGDSVCGDVDVCPETVLPEAVPTVSLGVNRFADTDGDGVFDTISPSRKAPKWTFTITQTAGCSCDQILSALRLGKGLRKFGCPQEVMTTWTTTVSP